MISFDDLQIGTVVELKDGEFIKVVDRPDASHVSVVARIQRGWSKAATLRTFKWVSRRAIRTCADPDLSPNQILPVIELLGRELERLEWFTAGHRCPRCGAKRDNGHTADCSLSDALNRAATVR